MIATMKMIVLFLVTTLLLNYSLGNTESESVEALDVAKQGILINNVSHVKFLAKRELPSFDPVNKLHYKIII